MAALRSFLSGLVLSAVVVTGLNVPAGMAAEASDSLTSTPAAANGNSKTYVDEQGVVHYKFDPSSMPGLKVREDIGERDKEGSCQFAGGGSGNSDSEPTIEVGSEITFDPKTCTRQLAVASYRLDEAPESILATLDVPGGMTGKTSEEEAGAGSEALLANWYGSINARVQDPPGFTVSSTTASHTWNSAGVVSRSNNWNWLAATGWYLASSSTANTSTATNTKGLFINVPFCNISAPTYSNHSRTEFRGYTSGLWDWGYNTSKWGDCDFLLSYHYSVVTP